VGRRVFVSYSRSDRRLAGLLVRQIQAAGHLVWIDESGIDAGDVWARQIVEAIRSSQVVVLLATAAAVRSRDVQKEVDVAGRYGVPIVPAVVPPVTLPPEIEYHVSGRHQVTIDPEHPTAGFAALAAELEGVRPARRRAPSWVPVLVVLLVLGIGGLGAWVAGAGTVPPWQDRPPCRSVTAEVVAASPATFGTFDAGATLDVVVRNASDRVVNVPPAREVTARGASGQQYRPESSLADASWFFALEVQPGSSSEVELGLSSPRAGSDVVTVTIDGVNEAALPFLRCTLSLAPVGVTFAGT
jgi:hypothetical protein